MSRFYRELHDRELLVQAQATLQELQQRSLIDIVLPSADRLKEERDQANIFPRRLSTAELENGRLVLTVEKSFFS